MKHQTPESMKFRKLQRRLGCSRLITVGTLELLWISVQKNTPQGDIGRFTNEEIAIECEWEGDPDELVSALVDTGWLDACQVHRLVVHDWQEHCPGWVRRQLARHKKDILTATNGNAGSSSSLLPVTDDAVEATPNLTQPNLTQPKTNAAKRSPRSYPDEFENWWSKYPANASGRKRGKATSYAVWKSIPSDERQALIEATRQYAAEAGEFVRDPERFLKKDWWRDWIAPPDSTAKASSSRVATAEDLANWQPTGMDL